MADMGIQISSNGMNVNNGIRPLQGQIGDGALKTKDAQAQEEKKRIEPALENLVAVSEDGDTVQATEEGMERLEEDAFGKVVAQKSDETRGTVQEQNITTEEDREEDEENPVRNDVEERRKEALQAAGLTAGDEDDPNKIDPTKERLEEQTDPNRIDPAKERIKEQTDPNKPDPLKERLEAEIKRKEKEEERKEERENIDTTKDNSYNPGVSSFKGYTDEQLEQLYIKGEISKNDYDKEMDARKEREEELENASSEFNKEFSAEIAAEEQGQLQAEELKNVFSPDSNDNLTPQTRDDILTKLQDFSLNN